MPSLEEPPKVSHGDLSSLILHGEGHLPPVPKGTFGVPAPHFQQLVPPPLCCRASVSCCISTSKSSKNYCKTCLSLRGICSHSLCAGAGDNKWVSIITVSPHPASQLLCQIVNFSCSLFQNPGRSYENLAFELWQGGVGVPATLTHFLASPEQTAPISLLLGSYGVRT